MSFWGQVCVAERLVLGLASRRFLPGSTPNVSVRWRKPFALGTAPTKVFRIPKKPVMPEDQEAEFMRLTKNYKTYMKSIRFQYFFYFFACLQV
jgi:Mitochondrial ribosome subunit S26